MMLIPLGACTASGRHEAAAPVASDGIPRITALYEQAAARPVHPFRKPVRDEQSRARQELQAECNRWLADLQTEAVPAALTGPGNEKAMPPAADVRALQSSLEKLRFAAGQADPAAMRAAHAQALAAYQGTEPRP